MSADDLLNLPDLLDQPRADGGARTITTDVLGRLRRHYLPPQPMPGGVFVTEVGENGAWGAGRRCDALYVGFTSSSGRLLIGHEIKATRADWLHELATPHKADTWADQCHEWWLVTAPGVVADGELPDGWGLMVPGRSRTRMTVVQRARRHPDRTPSWGTARSIMARLDTLQRQEIQTIRTEALTQARNEAQKTLEDRVESGLRNAGADIDRLARYDEILGRWVDEADLAAIARLYRDNAGLRDAHRHLVGHYVRMNVQQLRRACDEYEQAVNQVLDAAQSDGLTLEAGAA